VIIQCLFETIDESVEEEAESIFKVLFLSTRFDVIIALENPVYITPNFLTLVLNVARELKLVGRNTTLLNAPESIVRYLERFDLDKVITILNN
jgi:hypothetical protein